MSSPGWFASAAGGPRATLRRLGYGLRTEGGGAAREAAAVGVGVFVGCSPFYGFHLLLCLGLGTLLRLNRLKVYLAANISNPFVAPFLVFAQVQVGAWLRAGSVRPLSLQALQTVDPWLFGGDLLLGSAVVGGVLATIAAAITWAIVRVRSKDEAFTTLVQRAADRYVAGSLVAWEFARGKLHRDPVYETVIYGGLLPSGGTLVDVGCGQGLMLALLVEAADAHRVSIDPPARQPPPVFDRLMGIELRPRVAALARAALAGRAEIVQADAINLAAERCSAILLFDVLHMMAADDQARLLRRLGEALTPDGVMLIREADAAAGWRFAIVRMVNSVQALRAGAKPQALLFRNQSDWLALFGTCGLDGEVCAQHGGATLGNVLFRVTARKG